MGRGTKYLKTLYILKKRNAKIILNNNTNVLVRERAMELETNKFKFIKILKYYLDKIYYILFRLSNFTNLIPYIDIVFDANQKNINHLTVYCSKKLEKNLISILVTIRI